MIEIVGDLFNLNGGTDITIPTNGVVGVNGRAVMGAGVALIAKQSFENIDLVLGKQIKKYGNIPTYIGGFISNINKEHYNVFSFPTKNHWKDPSDLDLIINSANILGAMYQGTALYMPKP